MAKPSIQQLILEKITKVEDNVRELHRKMDMQASFTNAEISDLKERAAKSEGFVKILVSVFLAVVGGVVAMFVGFWNK